MMKLRMIEDISKDATAHIDIEEEFKKIRLTGKPEERKAIKVIEKGRYNDEYSFIDRFGFKLFTSELSIGCKAALCIINNPDKEFNLMECGVNAEDFIISYLKEGNVVLEDREIDIVDYGRKIDKNIKLDDYVFDDLKKLNYYLLEERPYKPDLGIKGVKYVHQ